MRAFIFVTCLAACALAHPEAGYSSYNGLQQQQNQGGLPQSAHIPKPYVHQQLPHEQSFGNFVSRPQQSYGAPAPLATQSASEQQLINMDSTATPIAIEEPTLLPQMQQQQQQQQSSDSYNQAFQNSVQLHESGYGYEPEQMSIHKHIYVHVPPQDFEEEDEVQPRVVHQVNKQKHYKIVFIKAPAAPKIRAPVIPPPPQNEEKTLIYVLHKKPEPQPDIIIPTAVPTKPTKPEVYFIKYRTRKEEAPVYGPPAANQQQQQQQPQQFEMEPRHIVAAEPGSEYGAPEEDFTVAESGNAIDINAPFTTLQPAIENEQQQPQQPEQYIGDVPTVAAFADEQQLPSTAETPSNQYLTPLASSTSPIVVEEMQPSHVPASNYGPPSRFFLKKKK